jgi:serine phosphatase RsbU (regulator of sigma subunit)
MMNIDIDELKERLCEHDDDRLYLEADVLMSEAADALSQLQAENAELRRELEEARRLLAHAVKEADAWHDECHGEPITDDPMMEAARQMVARQQQGDNAKG